MKIRGFLLGIFFSFLITFSSFLSILFFSSPEEGFIYIFFFYITLFIVLICLSLFVGFAFSRILKKDFLDNFFQYFKQSVLVSFFLILFLIFQNLDILNWWSTIILIVLFFVLELLFLNKIYH